MSLLGGLFGGGPQKTADYDPGLGGHILGGNGQTGLLGDARNYYNQGPPQYDPNYRIMDFTGAEQAGQRELLNYARNNLPAMFNQGMGGLNTILGGAGSNPFLGQTQSTLNNLMMGQGNPMLQAAGSGQLSPHMQGVLTGQMNDFQRNYQNTTGNIMDSFQDALGSADDSAMMAGQFGGSRGGVARGIMGEEAAKQVGLANQALSENMQQATSNVLNEQFSGARNAQLSAGQSLLNSQLNAAQMGGNLYNSMANNQLQAINMLPMMGEFGQMGGRLQTEVGGVQRAMDQAQLDLGREKWNFGQNAPWNNMNNYANLIAQLGPFMSMGTPQGGKSPLAAGMGGAAAGFGSGGGVPGAILGGVAGLMS